jgi:hypothetical protein
MRESSRYCVAYVNIVKALIGWDMDRELENLGLPAQGIRRMWDFAPDDMVKIPIGSEALETYPIWYLFLFFCIHTSLF